MALNRKPIVLFSISLLRKSIGFTFLRQIITIILQLITVVLVARFLGPTQNGIYAMALLIPNFLAQIFNFGLSSSLAYFVGRKTALLAFVFREALRLTAFFSFLGVLLSAIALNQWGALLVPGVSTFTGLLAVMAFPVLLLTAYVSAIFQGLQNFHVLNLLTIVSAVLNLLGTLIVLLVFKGGVDYLLVVYFVSQAVGLVIGLRALHSFFSYSEGCKKYIKIRRSFYFYGIKAFFSNILTFLNYRVDIYLVNVLLGPSFSGLYVVAMQIAEKLWVLSQSVSLVLFPRIASKETGDQLDKYRLTLKAAIWVMIITAGGAVMVAIAAETMLVPIFGSAYEDAILPLMVLLPGIVSWAVARVFANTLAAVGRPETNLYASFYVLIVNVGFNLLLIPSFGLAGAALATTFSYVAITPLLWFFSKKYLRT